MITIPAYAFFIVYGHLQRGGAGWSGTHPLRYQMFLVRQGHLLNDAVACAYVAALGRVANLLLRRCGRPMTTVVSKEVEARTLLGGLLPW